MTQSELAIKQEELIRQEKKLKAMFLAITSIFNYTPEYILSGSKKHPLPYIVCIIANKLNNDGYDAETIGRIINRDRTTIIGCIKKYPEWLQYDKKFNIFVNKFNEFLEN
jgi:hypothetical protein